MSLGIPTAKNLLGHGYAGPRAAQSALSQPLGLRQTQAVDAGGQHFGAGRVGVDLRARGQHDHIGAQLAHRICRIAGDGQQAIHIIERAWAVASATATAAVITAARLPTGSALDRLEALLEHRIKATLDAYEDIDFPAHVIAIEDELRKKLAMRVTIKLLGKDKGQVVLGFDSNDDFERLVEISQEWPEDNYTSGSRPSGNQMDDDADRQHDVMSNAETRPQTLTDYLIDQFHYFDVPPEERAFGEYLIQNLDDNGRLQSSLPELCQVFGSTMTLPKAEHVLSLIQKLDPPGVGARDLKECLLLQIKPDTPLREQMMTLITGHFDDLLQNRLPLIERKTGYSMDEIKSTMDQMRILDPYPGRGFMKESVQTVTPDLKVDKDDVKNSTGSLKIDIPGFGLADGSKVVGLAIDPVALRAGSVVLDPARADAVEKRASRARSPRPIASTARPIFRSASATKAASAVTQAPRPGSVRFRSGTTWPLGSVR